MIRCPDAENGWVLQKFIACFDSPGYASIRFNQAQECLSFVIVGHGYVS